MFFDVFWIFGQYCDLGNVDANPDLSPLVPKDLRESLFPDNQVCFSLPNISLIQRDMAERKNFQGRRKNGS
jgi:hypothetical protein